MDGPKIGMYVDPCSSGTWNARVIVHSFGLGVVLESCLSAFPPNAALLVASEWDAVMHEVVHVDPRRPRLQRVRHSDGSLVVLRMHRCCQAVARVVGQPEHLRFAGKGADGDHRTEDFISHDLSSVRSPSVCHGCGAMAGFSATYLHLRLDVGEDRRLDIIPAIAFDRLAAQMHGCAIADARVDVTQDFVVLHLAVHGTLVHAVRERLADLYSLHALRIGIQEPVIDRFVNKIRVPA